MKLKSRAPAPENPESEDEENNTLAPAQARGFKPKKVFHSGSKARRNFRRLIALAATLVSLARPLPTNAEITVTTKEYADPSVNPPPTAANMELLTQAVYRLAGDPRLANHPIARYLNDPQLKAEIIFDNPEVLSYGSQALAGGNQLYLQSNRSMVDYLLNISHEFIHIAVADKYVSNFNYSFLAPEDFAFRHLMEEAFASSFDAWLRLTYPEIPTDRQIRNWRGQPSIFTITDAMRNDLKATTNLSDDQINAQVATEMFNIYMTEGTSYSLKRVPMFLKDFYGNGNTFLLSAYNAYRDRGDALMRHQWNYLASMMPFSLPSDKTYDYYRNRFKSDVEILSYISSPEDSILYWTNYDYIGQARAKLAQKKDSEAIYNYLSREDEERLNRVMKEIDPYFTPVNTGNTDWRLYQERLHGR